MNIHVTIIPSDSLIIVDGEGLYFPFTAPHNMHAVQWHEGAGHIEFTDGKPNQQLAGDADFAQHVQPFVVLWQQEKARLEAAAAQAERDAAAAYNSLDTTRARKLAEIATAYETVLSYVISPDSSSAVDTTLAIQDFNADDPEGLAFIRQQLKARRTALEAAVAASFDTAAVQAIVVTFKV